MSDGNNSTAGDSDSADSFDMQFITEIAGCGYVLVCCLLGVVVTVAMNKMLSERLLLLIFICDSITVASHIVVRVLEELQLGNYHYTRYVFSYVVLVLSFTCSVWFLMLMAVQRYLCVCKNHIYRRYLASRVVHYHMALGVLISAVCLHATSIILFFPVNTVIEEPPPVKEEPLRAQATIATMGEQQQRLFTTTPEPSPPKFVLQPFYSAYNLSDSVVEVMFPTYFISRTVTVHVLPAGIVCICTALLVFKIKAAERNRDRLFAHRRTATTSHNAPNRQHNLIRNAAEPGTPNCPLVTTPASIMPKNGAITNGTNDNNNNNNITQQKSLLMESHESGEANSRMTTMPEDQTPESTSPSSPLTSDDKKCATKEDSERKEKTGGKSRSAKTIARVKSRLVLVNLRKPSNPNSKLNERSVSMMLVAVFTVFLLVQIPYGIIFILSLFHRSFSPERRRFLNQAIGVANLFTIAATGLNFFICVLLNKRFSASFQRVILRRRDIDETQPPRTV